LFFNPVFLFHGCSFYIIKKLKNKPDPSAIFFQKPSGFFQASEAFWFQASEAFWFLSGVLTTISCRLFMSHID